MRIGQLAQLAEVSPKAIRRYEALGLVTPARHPNGYREYDEDTVRLVREIRALNRLGIAVEETRPFLECLSSGSEHVDDCPASLAEYRRAIHDLTGQIETLTARRDELVRRLRDAAQRNTAVPAAPSAPNLLALPNDLVEPEDDGAAAHLPGMRMLEFAMPDTDGARIDLAASGDRRTVVYLFPMTGRPDTDLPAGWDTIPGARGCTVQACGFRDHHADLIAAGVDRVFGLSSQDSDYQREVVARLHLPFTMLSDPSLRLADALSLPTFEADGTRLYRRLTLIIRDGAIEHVFYPVFPPNHHAEQVLSWLKENPL
ncbi:redoxin family protein [Nocardia acidivorans]|uniref:redoxin family protein n=1 Tax=Nocardia acidivorans TaxID=404580 RepID=UPI000832BA29|nr:redoxin family protein [Nocardia acidivorans]